MSARLAAGVAVVCAWLGIVTGVAHAAPCPTAGPDLILTNTSCTMAGVYTFGTITLTNSTITVSSYTGGDKSLTGNLQLRAKTITIDAASKIVAKGAGYQTGLCANGSGPTANGGGRGGCSVRDSGGGGAHFGGGGRGTIDNPTSFPRDYEEDCSAAPVPAPNQTLGGRGIVVTYTSAGVAVCHDGSATGTALGSTNCDFGGAHDSNPTVAGQAYYHSIYQPEFGSSGGDKGCLDGDGKDPAATGTATGLMVAGAGGGRIVLAGIDPDPMATNGTVTINGQINANGKRGCGIGNDSGGGGAGGTVVIAGQTVNIGATAVITAAGGLGGDTQGLSTDPTGECAAPYQQNQTADDCGGGGGGGIVSVLSIVGNINDEAVFSVNGAAGGVSALCRGEAGGGVGELQISNGYVGEFCDGYDNDFDGLVDEGLPDLACPGVSMPSCIAGVPQQCPADVPACEGPVTDSRARFAVIVDTSGSMLGTLPGVPTFGDGSVDHPGHDFDGNGKADDSRLFKAKTALTSVIAGYPDIDFALARYHQDEGVNRSCQEAHNFECNSICCSYDDPSDNTGAAPTPACTLNIGTAGTIADKLDSPGNGECINYAGNCGPPRRGADVLVGFDADINNYLMWLDGKETNFKSTTTPGAFCDFASGGDCELRATGPTPLANSLQAIEDYLGPIKACDKAAIGSCRKYGVILLTDGAESCQGDPVSAASSLRAKGISTYVIGFSTLASEAAQLNAIASAGGTGSAFLVGSDDALANALATIVSGSIVFETCNGLDDDCDGKIDEGFTVGTTCDNGQQGACHRTGTLGCTADGSGVTCSAATVTPGSEGTICNGIDDDCDGKIDEGVPGCTCIAQGETCNNMDDDCDGKIDEGITRACGTGVCQGVETCSAGAFQGCTARTPTTEVCNGFDDDCDGVADGFTQGCSALPGAFSGDDPRNNPGGDPSSGCALEGPAICVCHPGQKTCPANGSGVFGSCTGEVGPSPEICNGLDDDCDGVVDEDTGGQDCSTSCGIGTTSCTAGVITCNATTAMTDDTCDGHDDDCDGRIDEDYVGGACGTGLVCNGMDRCINGMVQCEGDPITPEVCNCLDDNCDGQIDNGATCPGGATCTNCQCAFPCGGGEFPCPSGKACVAGFCVADPCFNHDCPAVGGVKQVCQVQGNAGVCVNACDTVTCTGGLVCKPSTGACVANNCTSFPEQCAANQVCINGTCSSNPCAGVTCTNDQYCVGVNGTGTCVSSCAGVDCPGGQRCELGQCVADPCGHPCPTGQVCHDATGTCGVDPCTQVLCPQGQWCDPHGDGTCSDDPCVGTTCPGTGQVCVGGTCDVPHPTTTDAAPEYITTGGGGGCATTNGDGAGALALVLGLWLARRRRGGAR